LLHKLSCPLNIDDNEHHPYYSPLSAGRDRPLTHKAGQASLLYLRPAFYRGRVGGKILHWELSTEFEATYLLGLDIGRLDHLAPFIRFVSDELRELSSRHWQCSSTQLFESLLDL
jgi:hypothetical protein